jgi:hypothetical protein
MRACCACQCTASTGGSAYQAQSTCMPASEGSFAVGRRLLLRPKSIRPEGEIGCCTSSIGWARALWAQASDSLPAGRYGIKKRCLCCAEASSAYSPNASSGVGVTIHTRVFFSSGCTRRAVFSHENLTCADSLARTELQAVSAWNE